MDAFGRAVDRVCTCAPLAYSARGNATIDFHPSTQEEGETWRGNERERERESVVRIDTSRNAVDVCEIGDAIGRYTRYRVYATANRERERVRGVIFPFFFEFIFFHNTRKR